MPLAFKIYWALHNTALITSFVVTIIYWSFLHSGECLSIVSGRIVPIFFHFELQFTDKLGLAPLNILCHACNSAIMFLDILIVAYPLRLFHVIQPIAFAACFGIFSLIYFLCGGKDMYVQIDWFYASVPDFPLLFFTFRRGNPWIYPILDWAHPEKAIPLVLGILIIAIAVHICLFWIYKLREFIHRRYIGIEINLQTKSMEFNENNGYTNNAFKTTIAFE